MENMNIGNIKLNENAPRDNSGKRRGNFSQIDHSINAAIPKIGLAAYGIYHFLLNNAGGNFWCTAKTLAAVFRESEYCINQALAKLEDTGWISKKRTKNKGIRPLYEYYVNEVSTKLQAAGVATANITPAEKAPAPIPSPPITTTTTTQNGDEYKQHIFNICQSKGAFSKAAQEKVIDCCRMWYAENHSYPNDNLIATFANHFSANSGQDAKTVYNQCCPRI